MARTATLAQMLTRCRRYADMRVDPVVDDTEILDDLNLAISDLYGLLVAARGARYYESPTPFPFSTVGNTATYALPTDFFELSRLAVLVDGRERNLDRFVDAETDDTQPVSRVWSCRLYYVPAAPILAAIDSFDGINGWEDYACIKVAIKLKQMTEQDPSILMAMLNDKLALINGLKHDRDKSKPFRMPDLTVARPWWDIADVSDAGLPRYQLKNGVIEIRDRFA